MNYKSSLEQKPQLVLLFDNSESQQSLPGWNKDNIKNIIASFEKELHDKFMIQSFVFSDKMYSIDSLNFKGKSTNISQALSESTDRIIGDHIVSVALFSDGIYNQGNNPIYAPIDKHIELNTVLVGDTTEFKDLLIGEIEYSKYAYLNEILAINVDILSRNLSSHQSTVTITEELPSGQMQIIKKSQVFIHSNTTFETVPFDIQPNKEGLHHYKIEVSCLKDEKNCSNNIKHIFVEVVNGKKNILFVANAPHPDLSAIISSASKNSNFNCQLVLNSTDSKLKIEDYDLVVLYQLPSMSDNISVLMEKLKKSKTPLLYILGSQSNMNLLSTQLEGFSFTTTARGSYQMLSPIYNQKFNLFILDEKTTRDFKLFPPLYAPFTMVQNKSSDLNLLNQKIGSVETDQPLIGFSNHNDQLAGIIVGENLWKWKYTNYFNAKNTDAFDDIIFKTLNYLTIKKDKSNFRVTIEKQIFNENEQINFNAVLYNSVYQQVTDGEVSMTIHDRLQYKKEFKFIKKYDFYNLNIGSLTPGYYEYEAKSIYDGKPYSVKGSFHVAPINIETSNTTANFQEMNTLSQNSSGKLFFPNEIESLIDRYKKKEVTSKLVEQQQTFSLNDWWFIMLLLLVLFSTELIFRKYIGTL